MRCNHAAKNKQTNKIMKLKRNLIALATGASLFAYSANAEIIITDELSLYGYMDLAYSDTDNGSDESSESVAEFELGFLFETPDSPFFAQMELSFSDDDTDDTDFETAIVGYNYNENLVLSAGNILSYQGWETYDATGLYQFSYAGRGQNPFYTAAYAVGAAADYATDSFALGVWIGDSDDYSGTSYEFLAAYTGVEGLTIKAIYADDPGYTTYNLWASYELGGFTFAAEYIINEYEETVAGDVDETNGYLLLVNYAWEKAGLTLRYSAQEDDLVGGGSLEDFSMVTLSPSYVFSDKLSALVEVSFIEEEEDETFYAVEMIYAF